MPAHWDRLPSKARVRKPRREPTSSSAACRFRCWNCKQIEKAYAAMERHLNDEHDGHGRIECVIDTAEEKP